MSKETLLSIGLLMILLFTCAIRNTLRILTGMTMTTEPASSAIPTVQLHHRLAIAMEHAGVNRGELAELLGVTPTTITNYTRGHNPVPRSVLLVWAMRCGVSLDWLEHGEESTGDDDPGMAARLDRRASRCTVASGHAGYLHLEAA